MNPTLIVPARTDTICSEEFFRQTLVLERRRTERSGRGFLLVLIEVEALLSDPAKSIDDHMEQLITALTGSTREIDVKGWYRPNSLLGIICTEVSRQNAEMVAAKIKGKLSRVFDAHEISEIRLHLVPYPEYEKRATPGFGASGISELQPERKGMFYS